MNAPVANDTRRDLRADILREATELFAEQGFAKTSIREVTQASGCTKPALYYYFSNKEELYREVVHASISKLTKMIEATLHLEGSIRERLHVGCRGFFEFISQHPSVIRLLWRIDLDMRKQPADVVREFMGARELHMRFMSDLFRAGIASGELRADVDPEDCAVALAGTIDFQIQLSLQGEPRPLSRIDATLDLIFDGISNR